MGGTQNIDGALDFENGMRTIATNMPLDLILSLAGTNNISTRPLDKHHLQSQRDYVSRVGYEPVAYITMTGQQASLFLEQCRMYGKFYTTVSNGKYESGFFPLRQWQKKNIFD